MSYAHWSRGNEVGLPAAATNQTGSRKGSSCPTPTLVIASKRPRTADIWYTAVSGGCHPSRRLIDERIPGLGYLAVNEPPMLILPVISLTKRSLDMVENKFPCMLTSRTRDETSISRLTEGSFPPTDPFKTPTNEMYNQSYAVVKQIYDDVCCNGGSRSAKP
jgi:hypothetical protein